ncbi:MAG: HYR domain-containing protein [Bacteroidota bacterium]
MRRFFLLFLALSLWSFDAQAQCDDPVAITMTNEFCPGTGASNSERRIRVQAPPGANEEVIWTLTSVPTGSQFEGMVPMTLAQGDDNDEFTVDVGSKGNTVKLKRTPNNMGTPIIGTYEFSVQIVDNGVSSQCPSAVGTGYSITVGVVPPVAEKIDGNLCQGQDAATVFVEAPDPDIEIIWEVVSAPSGAGFMAGDDLQPNTSGANYRTDLDANGRRLRITTNAPAGTYTFTTRARNTAITCESESGTDVFTIMVNEVPAVPTIDRQDLTRCRRETATISVLPATDAEFVWEVLEAPAGVSFAAGDRLEPNVDGSDYRTDLNADGSQFRTKGSARAGLYRFKVLARDVNSGCESELTTDELSITINQLPPVPTVEQQMAITCTDEVSGAVRVADPGAGFAIVWEVLSAPAGATLMAGNILEPNTNDPTQEVRTDNQASGRVLRLKTNLFVTAGDYTFKALTRNTTTGCEGDQTTEIFTLTAAPRPATPVGATMMKSLCPIPDLSPSLANTGINVSNTLSADEKVVWILTGAPAGSAYAGDGSEMFTTDNCGDPFKNFGELAVANSSKVIRVQDPENTPVGSYTFDAVITNCVTGCTSEALTGFEIIVIDDTEDPVAICPVPAAGVSVLTNASFEDGVAFNQPGAGTNWTSFGAVFGIDANAIPSAKDGDFYLKMFGGNSGAFQDNPVSPGDNLAGSVFLQNASFDPMLPGCTGFLKLEYFDASNNLISFTESAKLDDTTPQNVWTEIMISDVAPAGAATVRFVVIMQCTAGGAVFFDDASLIVDDGSGPPAAFMLNNDLDQCGAIFNFTIPEPTDNCGATSVADIASGSLFDVGTTTVTVTATDDAGNTGQCTFDVTVNDVQDPVANCPMPPSGGNLLTNASFENNNGFDQPFSTDWTPFDVASAVRVSDGRTGTAAQDGDSYLKMFGGNTGIFQDVPVTPGETLDASVFLLNAPFDPMLPGCTGFIKLEFLNAGNGVFGPQESTKLDDTTPSNVWTEITLNGIVVPAGAVAVRMVVIMQCSAGGAVFFDNASLETDAPPSPGDFTITPVMGQCGSTVTFTVPDPDDNCPGAFSIADPVSGSFFPVGMNTITVTAEDASGNTSTCTVTIDVPDEEAPVPACLDAMVVFNGELEQTVTIAELYDAGASFDNCGTVNLISPDMDQVVSCEALNTVINVPVMVEDASGNPGMCTATITVTGLPCGIMDNGGIGCTGGTSNFDGSEFTVTAPDCSPNTMLYIEDQTAFVFAELCGDGEITAQVTGLSGTGFAGVMMRESEDPAAKKMALGTNTIDRLRKEVRVIDGYPSSAAPIASFNQFWVRVNRTGDVFSAFASTDGVFWQPYLSQVIIMQECITVGLFTYSEKPGNAVTATFSDVSITGVLEPSASTSYSGNNSLFNPAVVTSTTAVSLFPNPARDLVTLSMDQVIGEEATITIFNTNGQMMQQLQYDTVENTTEEISIDKLPAGTYFVNVRTSTTQQSLRLVKQ